MHGADVYRVVITGLLALMLVSPAGSQASDDGIAILLDAPTSIRGVPELPVNAHRADSARYRVFGRTIRLTVIERNVPIPDDWPGLECAVGVLQASHDRGSFVAALATEAITVLVIDETTIPPSLDDLPLCPFLTSWYGRFQFFRQVADTSEHSFPAVIMFEP